MDEVGSFRVRDGLAAGLSRGRMRGPAFVAPYRGIRAMTQPDDPTRLAMAFVPRLPERAFFCGPTAALIWGLPMPRGWTADGLHVGVPAGTRRVDAAGVTAHHPTIRDSDIVWHRGVRITSCERTWCDLGSALQLPSLVAIADRLLWHRDPMTTRPRLDEMITSLRSTRGTRSLRTAMELATDRADSPPESEIRVALHLAGVPAPDINVDVTDKGQFVARPDLSWRPPRIALDYEGDHHRTDPTQWQRDLERFSRLQEAGWTCLRATAADYRNPSRLTRQLIRMLASE